MMKRSVMRGGVPALGVAVALTLGACSDSTAPDALDSALDADLAVVAADATIEDFHLMSAPLAFGVPGARGVSAAAQAAGPAMANGPAGRPGGMGGLGGALSGTREVTFFDADGNQQDAYDAETTASIHVVVEVAGEVSREFWSASLERSRDMTISGLAGQETERTFNGEGSEAVSRSRHFEDGTSRTYDMDGTFTYSDVVVPVPGSDTPWPLSGTITRHVSVEIVNGPNGDRSVTRDVTIVFDGDETATVTIGDETFEVDLSTRPGHFPLRGRRHGRGNGG